jgi:hypothetical protein
MLPGAIEENCETDLCPLPGGNDRAPPGRSEADLERSAGVFIAAVPIGGHAHFDPLQT